MGGGGAAGNVFSITASNSDVLGSCLHERARERASARARTHTHTQVHTHAHTHTSDIERAIKREFMRNVTSITGGG